MAHLTTVSAADYEIIHSLWVLRATARIATVFHFVVMAGAGKMIPAKIVDQILPTGGTEPDRERAEVPRDDHFTGDGVGNVHTASVTARSAARQMAKAAVGAVALMPDISVEAP